MHVPADGRDDHGSCALCLQKLIAHEQRLLFAQKLYAEFSLQKLGILKCFCLHPSHFLVQQLAISVRPMMQTGRRSDVRPRVCLDVEIVQYDAQCFHTCVDSECCSWFYFSLSLGVLGEAKGTRQFGLDVNVFHSLRDTGYLANMFSFITKV